jgi:hypothetical protein
MKLPILATVAGLVLAAAAVAAPDPGAGVTYGNNNSQPPPVPDRYIPDLGPDPTLNLLRRREASQQFKMACAADRQTFCEGRKSFGAVWECIRIRRSQLSTPCREATYEVERTSD